MKELPKAFEAKQYEDAIYKRWEESGFFNPDICVEKGVTDPQAAPFTVVLPPPNVTGTLHMGHASMLAIEDLMIRYHRMKGEKTLWLPGTDHAAVATESKVENLLIKEEKFVKPKEQLGREPFLDRVRQFAQASHDTIVNQCKKMGSSLDWSREAFTLDEPRNLAVRTIFKKMYDDGLIYRGYRVVNWSVKGQSTCSDDELVYVDRPSKLYTFTYGPECPISISTTRPETKLGDTAIAVHPEGKWKSYIGQTFTISNFGEIGHSLALKVIGSTEVDDAFGTGALGVTPAHSIIDFEMYQKEKRDGNDIGLIPVIDEAGRMTKESGPAYQGLLVTEAREKVVTWLREQNLITQEEEIVQSVGTSDRFSDVVEPLPKVQWFINVTKPFRMGPSAMSGVKEGDMVTLKLLMQTAVRQKSIEIIPERFEKTYFYWIDNLRDWCISRQIWYGHQIPVWYRGDEMYCDVNPPEGDGWTQDPDTLDTWFSSGLWTFSTLGWPEKTSDLQTYHPTSVLETGYDIMFFWVARMILMTTYALGDVPFKMVYLHGLVRDAEGRKMSKSLGNIINPLDMSEKYGTDATRLSLLIGGTPGNDMKLSEEKIAGFRNFTNKLWNISRFMLLNIEEPTLNVVRSTPQTETDVWILQELDHTVTKYTNLLEHFEYSQAGELLRAFTYDTLADWYLELAKLEGRKDALYNYLLNTILKLWHPFMPFVTETIWHEVYGDNAYLIVERWPEVQAQGTMATESIVVSVQKIVLALRQLKSDYRISKAEEAVLVLDTKEVVAFIPHIAKLAGVTAVTERGEIPEGMVHTIAQGVGTVALSVKGQIDTEKEKQRIQKEIDTVAPYIQVLQQKLSNEGFIAKAPPKVLEVEKKKLQDAEEKLKKLTHQLNSF